MKKLLFAFLFIITFLSCKEYTPNTTTSLNYNWEFSPTFGDAHSSASAANWQPATVPGVVQTDLLKLGKIPDPFILNNEDSIQWVSENSWIYKKTFKISSEILKKQKHILKFEGLDTYTSITLNGEFGVLTNNAFRPYEFDITEHLQENNTLEIVFSSLDKIENSQASKLNYTLPEASRVFTRKPQFQYGWDWGPTIKIMGIWRDVSLISYDTARLEDVYIETRTILNSEARLKANITVSAIKDESDCSVVITNNTTGKSQNQTIELLGGKNTFDIPIKIKNPKLWWTHNLGEPFLYDFTIHLKKGNTIIETVDKKVGIRTIELVTEKDSIGESFYFKLNGKAIYMKGANYIPQNIFLAEVTKKDREKLLSDAVEANMNMLRVWGGGVYEDDDFYDLCDEKGLLIWQDFMFACAMYPGDEFFLRNVKREAIDNVKRLRQHPSIALYCGNNENSEGWHRWGWQADKTEPQKEEIWKNYQAVFNDILPKVVDSLHTSISYWESSPKYGRGDKRYQFEGDAHDWWVWHDGYPFEHYEEEVPRFMSEFGFQSFPSYETIKHFTQEERVDLNHPSFATHQKHSRGFQLIREYMARDFPVATRDDDYVYVSQLLQAYGITNGIKAHRAAKPYNMGTLYWQLNDCWPVVSWSSIDGLGNWKALHYKVKRVFENRLIIPFEENNMLKIKVVDDSPTTHSDDMYVLFYDFFGNIVHETDTVSVSTFNDKNEVVFEVDLSTIDFDRRKTFAKVIFEDTPAIHYFSKPKDLQLLEEYFKMTMSKISGGVEITLKAETLQKDVFLYADTPGHFTDNFFDLLPEEEKKIKFLIDDISPKYIQFKTLNGIHQKLKTPL